MVALDMGSNNGKHLFTEAQKRANGNKWYKDFADRLDKSSLLNNNIWSYGDGENLYHNGYNRYMANKVNYDLFNGILNKSDLKYVYKPYGDSIGELPANMTNRDILSPKIKALLGVEMSIPFSWKLVATNPEATTRKETMENDMLKQYVTSEIMRPIQQQVALEAKQKQQGKPLTPAEQQQVQQQIAQETQARTPESVKQYMTREHQDPSEIQGTQILQYLIQEQHIQDKFNDAFKHKMLSGIEVMLITDINNQPAVKTVNSLFFDSDNSPEIKYIEDGAWAVAEYSMSPTQILNEFGSKLKDDEIERIYEYYNDAARVFSFDSSFRFNRDGFAEDLGIRVMHFTWKAPMKIGFLLYIDQQGALQEKIVNDTYKLNNAAGDLRIEWVWIPEAYECYKILNDIYVYARPVPGQNKDLDNLWKCKLPYYGIYCDNMNSITTAPIERGKAFQYYYDIIMYRIELLMASDKGKILAMNINAIPKSMGIDTNKFIYFMEANKLALLNPKEEGNKSATSMSGEITNMVKEIDMSLATQIDFYIKLAEYIEERCGAAMGVNKAMEGAIAPTEAVTNSKQNLVQSNYIVRPYFDEHNQVKRNVLQALIDRAKVTWAENPPQKLQYVLDDMSIQMLSVDSYLLDSSTYGLFVTNSAKAQETMQAIQGLSQAAIQNQQATLLDIAKIMQADSVEQAVELLEVAQQEAQEREQAIEQQKAVALKAQNDLEDKRERDKWAHDEKMVVLKGEEERKTEVQKAALTGLSFNPDLDADKDKTPDFLEIARQGVDANVKIQNANSKSQDTQIKAQKQALDEQKFTHQQIIDKEHLAIEKQKAQQSTTA